MSKSDAQSHIGTVLNRRQLLGATAAVGLSSACAPIPITDQKQPTKGRTLRLGMEGGSASDSLNPLSFADSLPISMGLMLWNNLVEIDDKGDATGELFENWEVRPGAAEWIFNIRKDVIFTSGKTLDADDVIYSLNMHQTSLCTDIEGRTSTFAALRSSVISAAERQPSQGTDAN